MKKTGPQMISFKREAVLEHARDFFVEACGFDLTKGRHQRMLAEAEVLLERRKPRFQMKALWSRLGAEAYENGRVAAGGGEISCNGFFRIKKIHVQDVYLCMITAGDWRGPDGCSTREQVYLDAWGTAFVDGAKTLLEQKLLRGMQKGQFLSDPFGPGYYGMPTAATRLFDRALDAGKIGVTVRDSGIMIPLKTISAIYLVTDSSRILPPPSCRECFGKVEGCRACRRRKQAEKTASESLF